ncbi:MAG: hypothetical protein GY940_26740, partial [bacterium]|nr:hypothetical protein [bacterium]
MLLVGIILLFLLLPTTAPADTVKLPGNLEDLTYYISFIYTVPGEDLLFHLNEIFLFETMPNFKQLQSILLRGVTKKHIRKRMWPVIIKELIKARKRTFTARFKNTVDHHREVKSYLSALTGNPFGRFSADLKSPRGFREAAGLMQRMGVLLKKEGENSYRLLERYVPPSFKVNHYYQWFGMNTWKLETKLNKTHRWEFEGGECELEIPWKLRFLRDITGLYLTPTTFARHLAGNRKLQILLGILFRLGDGEIEFINNLEPHLGTWKRIYGKDKWLTGMFLLCHGLRVKDKGLRLPGGDNAISFWKEMAGADPVGNPALFLENLATKDEGKLNWFYVFGFFLRETNRKAAFCDYDAQTFRRVYDGLRLDKKEKLKGLKLPTMRDFSLFTLFCALETREGKPYFPGGIETWAKVIGADESTFPAMVERLLKGGKENEDIKRFVSIYTKFLDRPDLMRTGVLRVLYEDYGEYNVMVDFIEKLPVRKPGTVLELMAKARKTGESPASAAVFQSLLALLAQGAKYDPGRYDYDELAKGLIKIPRKRPDAYDYVFDFLHWECGVEGEPSKADGGFMDFVLGGAKDPEVTVQGQAYVLETLGLFKNEVLKILEKQRACSFSTLVKINGLLKTLGGGPVPGGDGWAGKMLLETLELIPGPDKEVEKLIKQARVLIDKRIKKRPGKELKRVIRAMKVKGLYNQLKHFLVCCVYAVSARSAKVRPFINPNLVRMHDFSPGNGKSAWNCSGISMGTGQDVRYHLEGGLSRLEVTLAVPFGEFLFRLMMGDSTSQVAPVIYNNLDLFPLPKVSGAAQAYVGQMVTLGKEVLKKAANDEGLSERVRDELGVITSGYHYRKLSDGLKRQKGKEDKEGTGKKRGSKFQPYFRELFQLGTRFSRQKFSGGPGGSFSKAPPGRRRQVNEAMNRLGPIYYHTFGKLKPYRFAIFPQALSHLLRSKWTGGEMNDEFKIKAAYLSYSRGMPPQLLGHVIYNYLFYAAGYFSQFYENDYHKTYFMFNTFSYLYLNRLYKQFKRNG